MENTYIAHHGILGQKWGVRRFQNPDGSLKRAGQLRYGDGKKFRASNGMEVAPARNKSIAVLRKITKSGHSERSPFLNEKQKEQVKKERQALKEFDAHEKDMRKANKLNKKIDKLQAKKDKDVKSFDAIKEDMAYKSGPNKGKVFYSVQDAKRDQKALSDVYDKKISKLEAKRDIAAQNNKNLTKALRENNIERAYDEISKRSTGVDKFIYNDATRKKAAQIYADNEKLSYDDAMKSAKYIAKRNAIYATVASVAFTDAYTNGPISQFVSGSIKKTMAGNAARKATTKIGAKSLKKVAKNVYEWR